MPNEYAIATIGSHSALQILKGAKEESFRTIVIAKKGAEEVYQLFGVADEILAVNEYEELFDLQDALIEKKAIFVPHASLISYLGHDAAGRLRIPYYGNKAILRWESDRNLERQWLSAAGLKTPKIFGSPEDIDRPVIVKFHGARGGKGYFIAKNQKDFREKIERNERTAFVIQEYVLGVTLYAHYFYSPLSGELEIMGFDKRYESNVDSLGRISARDQMALPKVDPSYLIVGNIPLVVRESYLPSLLGMGMAVVRESQKMAPPGLFGPFCLETILTPDEDIYVFEVSARIVAGTNPYIHGSPYTWLKYNEPMSTGRRIAREIKQAIEQGRMSEIIF